MSETASEKEHTGDSIEEQNKEDLQSNTEETEETDKEENQETAGSTHDSRDGSQTSLHSNSEVQKDAGEEQSVEINDDTKANKDEEAKSQQEEAVLSVENICKSLEKCSSNLEEEMSSLEGVHMSEYDGVERINSLVETIEKDCGNVTALMGNIKEHVQMVRQSLDKLKNVVDEKIKNEELSTFLKYRADTKPSEYETLEDQEVLEKASKCRLALSRANQRIAEYAEKVRVLESEAADASADVIKTRTEIKAAEVRAEETKKAAEAKEKAEREAKEREEQERRIKEEEEKRLREEEEARQAELLKEAGTPEEAERRRKELERRDPKNWTPYVFSVDPSDLDIPIGCVIKAIDNSGLSRDEFTVISISQLDGEFAMHDSEELVSHIMKIEIKADANKLKLMDEPLSINIPHCAPRNTAREIVCKHQTDQEWKIVNTKDVILEDIKEYKFVEVRIREPGIVMLVSRWKRETFPLSKRSGKIISSVDSRITLSYKRGTFTKSQSLTVEVNPVELSTVSDVKVRHPEPCDCLLASSSLISFCIPIKQFERPITVTAPIPPGPNVKAKRPKTAAAKSNSTPAKNETRPKSAFMFGTTSNKEDEEEDDEVHILVYENESHHWIYRSDLNDELEQSKNRDNITIKLGAAISRFVILRTKVDVNHGDLEKIATILFNYQQQRYVQFLLRQNNEDAVDTIVQCSHISRTEKLLRRLDVDAYEQGPLPSSEIIIGEGQVMWLQFRGNIHQDKQPEQNPENSNEEITENESQEINHYKGKPLRLAYNTHIKNKLQFNVTEIDKFAQKSLECYRGFVQVYTRGMISKSVPKEDSEGRDTDNRSRTKNQPMKIIQVEGDLILCELLVNLAKPEQELTAPVCRTPLKITAGCDPIDGDILRHLSTEIGDDWKRLAAHLNVKGTRIQAIMRNNAQKDQETAIYDMLVTWAKRIPKSVNKTDVLCQALNILGRADLVEELRDSEMVYKSEQMQNVKDSIMNKAFIRVAQNVQVTTQWKKLAKQIGVNPSDIDRIENSHSGYRERCYQSLLSWRDTEGLDNISMEILIKHLRKCRFKQLAEQLQPRRE